MSDYFASLEKELEKAMDVASLARRRCLDPAMHPEIYIATDLADRVEHLVGTKLGRIEGDREEVALRIAADLVKGGMGNHKTGEEIIETAVRVGVAILTEGVVVAPVEGISRVKKGINDDGTGFIRVFYSGPIRSAGGTAQALSVLIADYARRKMGFAAYKPRKEEIERYVEEIAIYDRIANLQYTPTEEEIRLIVENCPVCIDGEATEEVEVEGHRDLQRVPTNRVRGGMALVIAEGIALKSRKLKKHVSKLDTDGWEWLDLLIEKEKGLEKAHFLQDTIAGRPIFAHPSTDGGFRLRYGRARNTGLSAVGLNPATMFILDNFIAVGTQLKMEIPGKAACVAPVDSIEGPTVQLGNGDILRVDSINDALKVMGNVSEILDLGEILISYGDFLENRQPLVPEGTRVGARMGRPEKSAPRKMKPSPHVLFPLGDISNRSILEASEKGEMEVEIGVRTCQRCGKETLDFVHCSLPTRYKRVERRRIDVGSIYHRALKTLGEDIVGVKGVKGLISRTKTPESIAKGILRKKHDVFVFKDGTIRYDMTNLPLTHFYPKEINVGVEKLRELGYESDAYGEPLRNGDQLVELNVQDVIVSEDAGEYLLRAACFIDDLLCKYYGLQPSYNVSCKEDLIGSLVIGLAPHTSAGIIGRILGFIPSSVCYAHPFFHAAKRRNADGDEDCLILLLDALINFSRYYLPEGSGGRMDTPLMISTRIDINEVDSEARNMDAMQEYPHDFYESLGEGKSEDLEEKMELISGLKDFWFTHSTSDIAAGPRNSAYTSGTMPEKVDAQLDLARRIHAVDEDDVAERIISCHFIPDLVGNLRAFSKQQFRCTRCNTKYRRPTLSGKCKCGAKLVLTVHEGSVKKYLELSKKIADSYHIKDYTRQRLNLIEDEMNSIFEPKIQMDLSEFV